jgi:hypothetical protein
MDIAAGVSMEKAGVSCPRKEQAMIIRFNTVTGNQQAMSDCWYPPFLNQMLAMLRGTEEQDARDWINRHVFDAALARPNRTVNVTVAARQNIPMHPDWSNSPLQPLFNRTGQNEEHAKWIYGNLICRVGVARPETWVVFPQCVGHKQYSSSYVLAHI